MRIYELGFILKPDLPEENVKASVDAVKQTLTDGGAKIDKVDDWGKRKLAYRVQGFWHGHYVFIRYSSEGGSDLNKEVERRLRVADNVVKFMTVRIDEDLKHLAKARERRAKRAPRLAAKEAARAAAAAARQREPGVPEPARPAAPRAAPRAG